MGLPEPPELGSSALPAGSYDGQVVVVTGGGTGLGKGIAVEYARLGASVVVLSRKEEHRKAGVEAIEATGARGAAFDCDIRQPEAVAAAFDAIESDLGLPDVLVNNAAGNFPAAAEDLSPNGWRVVVDIVLNGTFYCSRECGRRHIAAGIPGSILNIGAAYAWTGGPGTAHSAAAKAGQFLARPAKEASCPRRPRRLSSSWEGAWQSYKLVPLKNKDGEEIFRPDFNPFN